MEFAGREFLRRLLRACLEFSEPQIKNPRSFDRGFLIWSLAVSYSRIVIATLPSALSRFTSVFGMGTGGANSLWPPGKLSGMPINQRLVVTPNWVVVKQSLAPSLFSKPQVLNS